MGLGSFFLFLIQVHGPVSTTPKPPERAEFGITPTQPNLCPKHPLLSGGANLHLRGHSPHHTLPHFYLPGLIPGCCLGFCIQTSSPVGWPCLQTSLSSCDRELPPSARISANRVNFRPALSTPTSHRGLPRSVWDPDLQTPLDATTVILYCNTGTQHTNPHTLKLFRFDIISLLCMINWYSSSYSSFFTVLERQKSSGGGKTIKYTQYINENTVIPQYPWGAGSRTHQTPQSTDAQGP